MNIRDYYEKNWSEIDGIQMVQKLADYGYSIVADIPKGQCLDIGCGAGVTSLHLQKLGFQVEGCDIAATAVEKAKAKGINARILDLNTDVLPYKKSSYTLIWFSDVIEHVFWPDTVFSNLAELLVPQGYIFITTPNVAWFMNRIQLLFGKTLYDLHPEHIQWFNYKRLTDFVDNHGFDIVMEKAYWRVVPYPLIKAFPVLDRLNSIREPDNLFSCSYGMLLQKR